MALQQVVCAVVVAISLLCTGCHSQLDVCGRAKLNPRIIGGQDAPPGSWPWLAVINITNRRVCDGSLINNQWVLTTYQCVQKDSINSTEVSLGFYNLTGSNPNQVKRRVEDIICHPNIFSFPCLVKLSAPVNFTDYVQPVCLAAANSTVHNGTSSWITGFGFDGSGWATILQEAHVPVLGPNECRCYLGGTTEGEICTAIGPGHTCLDEGVPLVTKNDFLWIQIGVGIGGISCYGLPDLYYRVSYYQDWINDTVTGPKPGFVTYISPGIDSDLNFQCPTAPPPVTTTVTTTVSTTKDDSIFCGGENLSHFAHVSSLCIVFLTLFVLLGNPGV